VVEQDGRLGLGREVLVLGRERGDGGVDGAEERESVVLGLVHGAEGFGVGGEQVREGLAVLLGEELDEVDGRGRRDGRLGLGGRDDGAHLEHGDVVRVLLDGLDELGRFRGGVSFFRLEVYLAALAGDVHVPGRFRSNPGGL
jgi:hypothetical protein